MEGFPYSFSIDDALIHLLRFSRDRRIFLQRGIIYSYRVIKILINGDYTIALAVIWKSSCVLFTFFTPKNNRCCTTQPTVLLTMHQAEGSLFLLYTAAISQQVVFLIVFYFDQHSTLIRQVFSDFLSEQGDFFTSYSSY